jgi:hypothetical protein
MPWNYRTYESPSAVNVLETINLLVSPDSRMGWQVYRTGSRREGGWLFGRTMYWIQFRRRLLPSKPGACSIRVTGEDDAMLQFVIQMTAQTAAEFDVVSRRVLLTVGGVDLEPQDVAVDVAEIGPFNGQQDDTVSGKCWNVDDAGNVSEGFSEFSGVLIDTFAPPAPGVLGIRVIGEVADPVIPDEPVEDPVVEDPVIEDPVVEDPVVPEEPVA